MKQASGSFADKVFEFPVRVYYEDTDAQGIVYYANYLRFIERARTEMFRTLDMSPTKIQHESGTLIVVRRCDVVFAVPAKLEDELQVSTRIRSAKGARIVLEQVVERDGQNLVTVKVELALVTSEGRPQRIPETLQTVLTPYLFD